MVVGMDKEAVRIVPIEDGAGMVRVEDVHGSSGRSRPPVWVVVVMVMSTVGLLWMFFQGPEPESEPEPVELRTVYSVEGWEPTFESVKEFLPQPRSALGYTWSLASLVDAEFGTIDAGSDVRLVIGAGPGLIAVGSSSSSAAVWSSVDGATWSRVLDVDDGAGAGDDRWMSAVVVGGPGQVDVGGERSTGGHPSGVPLDDDRDDDAAVWTSVDGSVWTRVPHDEEVFGLARMWTVVAGGPGLVAFGDDLQQEVVGRGNAVGVWVSRDGLSWSRVLVDEAGFAGATVESVVAGGPGLVAVGHTGTDGDYVEGLPDDNWDAAVWVSPDGMSWSRVPHDEAVFGGDGPVAIYDVTVGGPGLVAVGGGHRGAIVWTSEDGFAWVRVPHDESIFQGVLTQPFITSPMVSVAAGEQGLLAVGEGADSIWTSNDGVTWTRIAGYETLLRGGHRVIAEGPGHLLFNGSQVWTAVPDGK
jgi:hypothetical protein